MKNKRRKNSIFDVVHEKYTNKKRITYEEYVILLATNDEIWFWYKDTEYQVDHGVPESTTMFITKYNGKTKISENSETFENIIDMLTNFKVEGKLIKDFWENVTY